MSYDETLSNFAFFKWWRYSAVESTAKDLLLYYRARVKEAGFVLATKVGRCRLTL
jgi:hypothetical protein